MPASKDLTGNQYGRLTVIKDSGQKQGKNKLWRCQCSCGTECLVTTQNLHRQRSCGCSRKQYSIEGERYGRLTPLKIAQEGTFYKEVWLCKCDCGNTKEVKREQLVTGHTKSCGCLQDETRRRRQKTDKERLITDMRASYRSMARKRGIDFKLSAREFALLAMSDCHYCGARPAPRTKAGITASVNGIDRVDSDSGYFASNTVPCCKSCNRAKWQMSVKEFGEWIERAFGHYKSVGWNK